jgi:hypothetical protein
LIFCLPNGRRPDGRHLRRLLSSMRPFATRIMASIHTATTPPSTVMNSQCLGRSLALLEVLAATAASADKFTQSAQAGLRAGHNRYSPDALLACCAYAASSWRLGGQGLHSTGAVRTCLRALPPILPSYSNATDRQRRAAGPVSIPASRRMPLASGRRLATAVTRACQSAPHSLSSQLCLSQARPRMRSG